MYIASQTVQCHKLGGNQIYMEKFTLIYLEGSARSLQSRLVFETFSYEYKIISRHHNKSSDKIKGIGLKIYFIKANILI